MTDQEVFDKVARHLLTQGKRSIGDDKMCAYRGRDNTMCAVGCLIPDEGYDPDLEGITVCDPEHGDEILDAAGLDRGHLELVKELQFIHDYKDPHTWAYHLGFAARDVFKLDDSVLRSFND